MTRWTALAIHAPENDVRCGVGQHKETKLWAGFIMLFRGRHFHDILLSSEPVFASAKEAKAAMKVVVAEVRAKSLEELLAA